MHRIFQAFIDRLMDSVDAVALRDAMADASAAFDLSCFAYLAMPRGTAAEPQLISTYPSDWTDYYLQSRYERLDPVILRALRGTEPFEWGLGVGPGALTKRQQQIFDEAATFDICCGFTIPIHDGRSYAELNAWLLDRCVAYAKAHPHPELPGQTIWQAFEAERGRLVEYRGRFDGFHAVPASVSKTCLVRFDNNKYSVMARAVGRPIEIHAYAERIVSRQDGVIVGEHARCFGRGATVYDPWHYVPVLARKPGALRNGAPFKDWPLPASLERVRRRLRGSDDGDRQMVAILAAVLSDGLGAVEAACREALGQGVHSADVILNILARRHDPGPALTILTPEALRLRHVPTADCSRYDSLRRAS